VILARLDLPQSQFDLFNAQTHRYRRSSVSAIVLGNSVPSGGWLWT